MAESPAFNLSILSPVILKTNESGLNSGISFEPGMDRIELPLSTPDSWLDLQSPKPISNYNIDGIRYTPTEQKLIDLYNEIQETELTYVTQLQTFYHHYVSSLAVTVGSQTYYCAPLVLFASTISDMVSVHYDFHRYFLTATGSKGNSVGTNIDIYNLIFSLCDEIEKATSHYYLYINYCLMHSNLKRMIGQSESDVIKLHQYFTGTGHYLEATQPQTKNYDLSFSSLGQMPITRYGKYRLFLDTIQKLLDFEDVPELYLKVLNTLTTVKIKLNLINEGNDASVVLELQCDLIEDKFHISSIGVPVSFFGAPLLIGCLTIVWGEGETLRSSMVTVLAFKAYLILVQNNRFKNGPDDILFVVPLVACQFSIKAEDFNGGLYTRYPYSFKILFEIQTRQYEILFAAINECEWSVWSEQMDTLINFVNGPYPMNFSMLNNAFKPFHKLTAKMSPYNISVKERDSQMRERCYFFKSTTISIVSYVLPKGSLSLSVSEVADPFNDSFDVSITRHHRHRAEKIIGALWSDILPKLAVLRDGATDKGDNFMSLTRFFSKSTLRSNYDSQLNETPLATTEIVDQELEIEEMITAPTHISQQSALHSRSSSIRALTNVLRGLSRRGKSAEFSIYF